MQVQINKVVVVVGGGGGGGVSGSSSRKVSREWLDTLWQNNKTDKKNSALSPKQLELPQWQQIQLQAYKSCYTSVRNNLEEGISSFLHWRDLWLWLNHDKVTDLFWPTKYGERKQAGGEPRV